MGIAKVVRVTGPSDIDLTVAHELRRRGDVADPGDHLFLDLQSTRFIDSSGLHVLLGLRRRQESAGGRLTVLASPEVRRLVELTGLLGVLDLAD